MALRVVYGTPSRLGRSGGEAGWWETAGHATAVVPPVGMTEASDGRLRRGPVIRRLVSRTPAA